MTTPATAASGAPTGGDQQPTFTGPSKRLGDRSSPVRAMGAGILILVVLAGVAVFLIARPARRSPPPATDLPGGKALVAYIGPLVFGTLLAAVIALVIATPLAVGGRAVHHALRAAPARRRASATWSTCSPRCPSIVYGLWGVAVARARRSAVSTWLNSTSAGSRSSPARSRPPAARCSSAGIMLAVMILPIITAVSREVFLQTPKLHEEAALALGATRWEMIRMAVLPFGRSGIISGAMLGLGRALGETMAVAIILSASRRGHVQPDQLGNPSTIAANIALQFPDSTGSRSTRSSRPAWCCS